MTTVIRSGAPQASSGPVPTGQAVPAESLGLGTEFRIARARKLIELRGQGTAAIPATAEAPGEEQSPELSGRPPDPHRPHRRGPWFGRILTPLKVRRSTDRRAVDTSREVGAQAEEAFEVPLPGKPRRAVGRTRSWITRLTLVGAPLVLIGGLAYSFGVSTGSARLMQPSSISAEDASAFHLNSYPADRAAAFGVPYLSLCWTHRTPRTPPQPADRLAALAGMTSTGVAAGCGWTGIHAAPSPLAVLDGTETGPGDMRTARRRTRSW